MPFPETAKNPGVSPGVQGICRPNYTACSQFSSSFSSFIQGQVRLFHAVVYSRSLWSRAESIDIFSPTACTEPAE